MQLDKTRLAIRQRTGVELMDLALLVLRGEGWQLFAAGAAMMAPLAVFNHLLVHFVFDVDMSDEERWTYVWWIVCLSLFELPIAVSLVTLHLGQTLFMERPPIVQLVRELARVAPQMLLFQIVVRLLLMAPVVTSFLPAMFWPYLNEIILLERNPIRGGKGRMSTLKRSNVLHSGGAGVSGRGPGGLAMIALGLAAAFVLWWALWYGLGVVFGRWRIDDTLVVIGLPLVLWTVAIYLAVYRFLAYVDLRIRREGWEVELVLRAERARLERQWS